MTQNFYTNVARYGNNILYRGVDNGRRFSKKIKYAPTLFIASNKNTGWKNLENENVEPMTFDTMKEAKEFVSRYEEVANFTIYGNTSFEYSFIAEKFQGDVEWDISNVYIFNFDIEVGGGRFANRPRHPIKVRHGTEEIETTLANIGRYQNSPWEIWDEVANHWCPVKQSVYLENNGFPDPFLATEQVTAVTITLLDGKTISFGCGEYRSKYQYVQCEDEVDLLRKFLRFWTSNYPDALTGWNIKYFDIIYLFNRIKNVLGEDEAMRLSPWGVVQERTSFQKSTGKELKYYSIMGIACLDYLELYKTFAPNGKSQESYSLDNIAFVELKQNKLSYDQYDSLNQLYHLDYNQFMEYNIKDVHLVFLLEDKLKLLELALTLAYDTKSNYDDVFTQTRMWDSLIYSRLLGKKIVVPPKEIKEKDAAFEGAYVKDPLIGMHHWVSSFDLDSLYPHLIMQYNISPENLIERSYITQRKEKLLNELRRRKELQNV